MRNNYVLIGGCQMAGIASALMQVFPQDSMRVIDSNGLDEEGEKRQHKLMREADCCLVGSEHKYISVEGVNTIKVPTIVFPAFHPDICYVRNERNKKFTARHYQSAIGVWCYKNGVDVVDAPRLFNKDVFKRLGYLDRWSSSAAGLKERFEGCNLSFYEYFNNVKRNGIFMHTVDHPKSFAIVRLAKLLAVVMGANSDINNKEIIINDGLAGDRWPVYPYIGDHLSVLSSWEWVFGAEVLQGLDEYMQFQYTELANEGAERSDLIPCYDQDLYDTVLSSGLETL